MKAELEETVDAAVKVGLLRDELVAEDALRRGEDYLRLTIDTIPVLAWCSRPDGSNEFLNQRWLDYTGLTIEEARGRGWQVAIHPDDLSQLLDVWQGLLASGKPGELEARLRRADGVYRWFLFRVEPLRDPQGTIVKWYGTNTDIDDRKRAEALLAAENQILEMVATGRPLTVILDGLCRLVDTLCDKSLASILLIDPNGRCLRRGAGRSFPEAFMAAVDGIEIGPCVGSCGTAAYRKEQVIVSDIATDPLWANYRELALAYGLRSGWSTPILSSDGSVLGVFGIYGREPRSPTPQHHHTIKQITHLASVAIERKQAAESLRASELLARGQLDALTHTLDALAQESDPDRLLEHVWRRIIQCGGKFCTRVFTPSSKTLISPLSGCVSDSAPMRSGATSWTRLIWLQPCCVSNRIFGRWASTRFCLCRCSSPDVFPDSSASVSLSSVVSDRRRSN